MNGRSNANGRLHAPGLLVHQRVMCIARRLFLLLLAASVAACTEFPQLDRTITADLQAAEYPALVPIEPLLANANANQSDPKATQATLQARVAGLRARAARLRGSVLSGSARQRLREGLH